MYISQLVKLREGQLEAAVGIGIPIGLALGNLSIPIVMQTIQPVLSLGVDFNTDFNTYSECVRVVGQGLSI